jgi:hypothetical protein
VPPGNTIIGEVRRSNQDTSVHDRQGYSGGTWLAAQLQVLCMHASSRYQAAQPQASSRAGRKASCWPVKATETVVLTTLRLTFQKAFGGLQAPPRECPACRLLPGSAASEAGA